MPEDDEGLDLAFLNRALDEYEKNCLGEEQSEGLKSGERYVKIYRHILYVTPTFSNPSAKTMARKTRAKLLQLARKYDILIISDDVYDFLRWSPECLIESKTLAAAPPRIVDLDGLLGDAGGWGNSISNGSFSKIVAPGVRVGWAEASQKMIE